MENESLGGKAITIPEGDRERIKRLAQIAAQGRAAQLQLDGYVQAMALDNGIPPETQARLVGDDILFICQNLC